MSISLIGDIGELVLGLLLLSLDLDLGLLLIELHEFGKIELGLLKKLDLSDEDVLEREDFLALLDNLLSNRILDTISKYIINNSRLRNRQARVRTTSW